MQTNTASMLMELSSWQIPNTRISYRNIRIKSFCDSCSGILSDLIFASDFFFARIRPVRESDQAPEGYTWIVSPSAVVTCLKLEQSPCMGEQNLIKCETSPVVYQDLVDGQLTWAGTYSTPFDASCLSKCISCFS